MSMPREGGCSCGAVRYRLTSEPLFTHCCHCLNCQRQTGIAFVINLLIEAYRVELLAGDGEGDVEKVALHDFRSQCREFVGSLVDPVHESPYPQAALKQEARDPVPGGALRSPGRTSDKNGSV